MRRATEGHICKVFDIELNNLERFEVSFGACINGVFNARLRLWLDGISDRHGSFIVVAQDGNCFDVVCVYGKDTHKLFKCIAKDTKVE